MTEKPSNEALPKIYLKKFVPNMQVWYSERPYTIEYIHISRKGIFVKLENIPNLVHENSVKCDLTLIDFNAPYNAGLR
jgi:hypothetical protein